MRRGRPTPPLHLSEAERTELERLIRRAKTSQALAQRARIVLACAAGQTNLAVAKDVRVSNATVGKWRRRFLARGLDGLLIFAFVPALRNQGWERAEVGTMNLQDGRTSTRGGRAITGLGLMFPGRKLSGPKRVSKSSRPSLLF